MRKMGGLGVRMPFIRNVFIVGALALAGLPILNGFWSKELVLEAGLKHGPLWVYGFMLFGVGVTAFYTIRMTWLVFFGTERAHLHVHETGLFMRIVTGLIALGTLTTWLVAGPFSVLLSRSLPLHRLEVIPTLTMIEEVLTAPTTWFALVVILGGVGIWIVTQRRSTEKQSVDLHDALSMEGRFSSLFETSFGFDWLNQQVTDWVQRIAIFLQKTQTGQLNWNILGIAGALLIVLALLWSYQ
jgi:NADH-quinone oxidoreductase subunit L